MRWMMPTMPNAAHHGRRRGARFAGAASGATAAALAPDAIEESARRLRLDDEWTRTLGLSAWAGSVPWGWLARLTALRERLVLSLHLAPRDTTHSVAELSDLLVGLTSVGLFAEGRGRLPSEGRRQAIEEITAMVAKLEANEEQLFEVSLYAQVHGATREDLEARTRRVEWAFGAARMGTRRALFEHLAGLETTLPAARDRLGWGRPVPGEIVAATYPFGAPALCMDDGVWYGRNTLNNTPLIVDPYAFSNSNSVVIGSSGAGKSAWTKVHLLRVGELGAQGIVIDPGESGEYRDLCAAVGGQAVRLSAGSHDRINPLDLPQVRAGGADDGANGAEEYDALREHVAGVLDLLEVLIAGEGSELGTGPKARLEAALFRTYRQAGITHDRQTHGQPAPLLADLRATLDTQGDDFGLAERLGRYCDGALRGLFSGRTTVALDNDLTVFELHGVEKNKELRAGLMHLVTQHVWRTVLSERRRRSVLVDEAHAVTRFASTGDFLARMAKQARKHWCETIAASQDPLDFTATAAGRALILNSCRTWLLRCEEVALPDLTRAAHLSEREQAALLRAPAGQGLLLAQHPSAKGERLRLPFEIMVSPEFAPLVFTDPVAGWGQGRGGGGRSRATTEVPHA